MPICQGEPPVRNESLQALAHKPLTTKKKDERLESLNPKSASKCKVFRRLLDERQLNGGMPSHKYLAISSLRLMLEKERKV
jgi:hypothetical protein